MSDNPNPTPEPTADPTPEPDQTFTQADVDRIVRERVQRERAKYADYDDLKAKAGSATTLEERVAEIERTARASEERALRAEVANAKGLTPNQAKRLVGATREELEADADELIKDIGAQKQKNNVSPREGNNPKASDDPMREFAKGLFAKATSE
jgi:hypothetical protein